MYDEPRSDDVASELTDASSLATLEPEAEVKDPAAEWTGPRCEKCDVPTKSKVVTICRSCGWYASLGTFVEVDPDWETATEDSATSSDAPRKSHLQIWLELLPRWSWLIIGSVLAVVVESVVVRFVTPAGGGLRATWSLSQLALGLITLSLCHVLNFLILAADDADFGVVDLFMKPLKLWLRAAYNLPNRLWLANSAACGLTAAVMSLLVIGGIRYERMWDWGFKEPVKQNLMGAVMDRVKELDSRGGADSLEDAISDFAGSQDLEPGGGSPEPAPRPRSKADCVILGYQVDREGRLATLFVGTAHRGELVYAGRVTPQLPDEQSAELLEKLTAIKSARAFIPIQAEAQWVRPKFTCRVTFDERLKSGRLRDLQWDALLGEMQTR